MCQALDDEVADVVLNRALLQIYLKNMDDFAAINGVYETMIPSPKPARTCIQAGKRASEL